MFKLYMILAYIFFFKPYISKYVIVSYLNSLVFVTNNSFATKIKNLDGHVVKNWILIEIQIRF